MSNYGIRPGYKANLQNAYYNDEPDDGIIWQPDVYRSAVNYAKQHNIPNIIDIGSGNGDKLYEYRNDLNITFIDFGANLDVIRSKFKSSNKKHSYIDQNFENSFPDLDKKLIENAVIICSDVIEHIRKMERLTDALVKYSKQARLLFVSTPDRDRMYGHDHNGHPLNQCHVREWRLEELKAYFRDEGMTFKIGHTRTNDGANQRATILVVAGRDFEDVQKATTNISGPDYLKKLVLKKDLSKVSKSLKWDSSTVGLLNLFDKDYFVNHYLKAIEGGYSITVNHFKIINQDAEYRFYGGGIENVDRLLLQYIETKTENKSGKKHYPVAFSVVHGSSLKSKTPTRLLTLSVEHLRTQYLLELLFGFNKVIENAETLVRLPNQANYEIDMAEKERLAHENHELKNKIESLEGELSRMYKNPARYAAKVTKMTARKVQAKYKK